MAFYKPEDFVEAPRDPDRVRRLVYENETLFLTIDFEPGYRMAPHTHPWPTLYYVTSGEGRALVGDEWRKVELGDLVMIPARTSHGLEVTTAMTMVEVQCNCPPSFVDWVMGRTMVGMI